jgi:glycosyltransferase involved in cell wall biosynthesis
MINRHSLGAFATGDLAERDFKRWGVKEKKIYFLPYAVNKPIVCEPDPVVEAFVRDRNLVFMHLGTLEHRKGIDVIMNAFSQVAKNKPSVCLVLVGKDCNNGGYNRLAKTLNLQDQILFKGTVLATSISSVVALTDVLVLASRHDGWGVVLNEAAATGKALLSTDMCSAAYHLIKEGINGFKVSSGSIGELASKMAKYISNPGMAKRHGQASLAIYEDFTPERNVERLMEGIACMQSKR